MRIHPERAPVALVIALLALFTAVVGVLAACGGNDSASSTTTSSVAAPPTTSTTTQPSFVSDLYGYDVETLKMWRKKPADVFALSDEQRARHWAG